MSPEQRPISFQSKDDLTTPASLFLDDLHFAIKDERVKAEQAIADANTNGHSGSLPRARREYLSFQLEVLGNCSTDGNPQDIFGKMLVARQRQFYSPEGTKKDRIGMEIDALNDLLNSWFKWTSDYGEWFR